MIKTDKETDEDDRLKGYASFRLLRHDLAYKRDQNTVREGVSVSKFMLNCFSSWIEAFWYVYMDGK